MPQSLALAFHDQSKLCAAANLTLWIEAPGMSQISSPTISPAWIGNLKFPCTKRLFNSSNFSLRHNDFHGVRCRCPEPFGVAIGDMKQSNFLAFSLRG
jgi:hypothetical protein